MDILKIVKKCKVHNHPEWCGYLQPAEILFLANDYAKVDKFHHHFAMAKTMKDEGKCNPTWFYFYPTKKFLKYIR